MRSELSFCFVALFHDDLADFIKSWIALFDQHKKFNKLKTMIDLGLGAEYNNISKSMQSILLHALPKHIQFRIKNTFGSKKKQNKSMELMQIRQQIHYLSKEQLINFLQTLFNNKTTSDTVGNVLKFGFEAYKQQIPSNILYPIINDLCKNHGISHRIKNNGNWVDIVTADRDEQQTLVYGFCRQSTEIKNKLPSVIIELCYYYYFILYCAQNTGEVKNKFKAKFGIDFNNFMVWGELYDDTVDLWDKAMTDSQLAMNLTTNSIERIQNRNEGIDLWLNGYAKSKIGIGQSKKWKIKIKPYIGNIVVGIRECGAHKIPNLDFSYFGFGVRLWSGNVFYGKKHKNHASNYRKELESAQTFLDSVGTWDNGEYIVTMELCMRDKNCWLKYWVNDHEWGIAVDKEIDKTKKYQLAIALLEPQTVQLIHANQDK